MFTVRRLIMLVGAALLVAGVIGLLVPVSVSGTNGGSIGCGNGVASDVSAARAEDNKNVGNSPIIQQIPIANQLAPQSHYVADCNKALAGRRAWSIPLAVIGILVILGALFVQRPRGAPATGI